MTHPTPAHLQQAITTAEGEIGAARAKGAEVTTRQFQNLIGLKQSLARVQKLEAATESDAGSAA